MLKNILGETYMNVKNFLYYAYYEIKYSFEECINNNCYMTKYVDFIHKKIKKINFTRNINYNSTSKLHEKNDLHDTTDYYDEPWEKV